jgi:agmatinase
MKIPSKHNFLDLNKKYSDYKSSSIILNFLSESESISTSPELKIIKASAKLSKFDEEMSREACYDFGIATVHHSVTNKNSAKLVDNIAVQIEDKKFPIIVSSSEKICTTISQKLISATSDSCIILSSHSNPVVSLNELEKGKERIKLVHVGGRNFSKIEYAELRENGVTCFLSREIRLGMYQNNWAQLIANTLSAKVFIYFDATVLDPSVISSSKEPGGLFWDETLNLLKIICQDKNISGIVITGHSHSKIDQNASYLISKLIYKIISYL